MARRKINKPTAGMAGKKAVEREMSEIEVRKVRVGLGLKFTAPVSLAMSMLILFMGWRVYDSTAESMKSQLNHQGVFAALIAASPEIDSWEEGYNTVQDLRDRLAAIDAAAVLAGASLPNGEGTQPQALEELRQKEAQHDRAQKTFNKRRLAGLLGAQGALDVYVVDASGAMIANASGRSKLQIDPGRPFALSRSSESKFSSGFYGDEPARFFTHPVKNRKGQRVGAATVVFSERGLQGDLAALKTTIAMFCVTGVLLCAGIAYATSRVLTRPLDHLIKDIKTVAGGDLEHRTKTRSNDELGVLAQTFDQMTKNLAAAEVMRVDLADKEHQVNLAQEVQERLFPKTLPEVRGLTFDASNRLSGELSADLFDTMRLDDGKVGLLVMTASGRGVPAAIVLSMARAIFRTTAAAHAAPSDALKAVNAGLAPDLRRGMYVSALYAVFDPATGHGALASAGHRVPALQYVADSEGLRLIQADGIAIGLDKGPVFDRSLTESAFELEPGDRMVLATEGAFLLQDADGNELGQEAFMRVVLAGSKKGVGPAAILSALANRLHADPGDHDLTLVMATRS